MLKLARCLTSAQHASVPVRPNLHHVAPAHFAPAGAALVGGVSRTGATGVGSRLAVGATVPARSFLSYRNALSVRKATSVMGPHHPHPADPFNQTNLEVANALNNPPPSIRSVIVRLLQNLSSKKEVVSCHATTRRRNRGGDIF